MSRSHLSFLVSFWMCRLGQLIKKEVNIYIWDLLNFHFSPGLGSLHSEVKIQKRTSKAALPSVPLPGVIEVQGHLLGASRWPLTPPLLHLPPLCLGVQCFSWSCSVCSSWVEFRVLCVGSTSHRQNSQSNTPIFSSLDCWSENMVKLRAILFFGKERLCLQR